MDTYNMDVISNFKSPQHRIVGELAYTEDDSILVYNVFIRNLPKGATTENLTEYFRKFGEVLKVGLVGNGRGKSCYINFADPKVASKVLQRADHILLNRPLVVQPCRSWYQPSGQRLLQLLSENFKNDSITDNACSLPSHIEQNALIFTLNDDCLEHICKELTLNDQVNFALTCQRFCEIFKMVSHVQYAHLTTELFSTLSKFKMKVFLHLVGSQIKSLVIDFVYGLRSTNIELKFIKFLGKFCKNVEKLKIDGCNLHINKVRALITYMPLIEEFELNNVEINVTLIKFLKMLKNLKFLNIKDNSDITGKNIYVLSDLEKLCLYGCQNIGPWHFKKICEHLKNLHYLDIRYCDLLKADDFEHIQQYLLQLETLKISTTSESFNSIAHLPKLKHLEIKDYHQIYVNADFFRVLAQHQAENLEELLLVDLVCFSLEIASLVAELKKLKLLYCSGYGIDDDSLKKFSQITGLEELNIPKCNAITDRGVVQFLERVVKLKRLNLTNCDALTPDLIRNVYQLLIEQRARYLRTDRLHLTITSTDLFICVINELGLDKPSDVLKITLDYGQNKSNYNFENNDIGVYLRRYIWNNRQLTLNQQIF
ncbi:uncharacterized protein LOC135960972 isoform X2 [Calliphora vicina]|uniref:uncharacterized protein LOC135960972 isoform X2 n=1 Tax=Calliphora vicina TaxID=7373 RepID=UPI00325BDAD4